jgi:hypothetical protein
MEVGGDDSPPAFPEQIIDDHWTQPVSVRSSFNGRGQSG